MTNVVIFSSSLIVKTISRVSITSLTLRVPGVLLHLLFPLKWVSPRVRAPSYSLVLSQLVMRKSGIRPNLHIWSMWPPPRPELIIMWTLVWLFHRTPTSRNKFFLLLLLIVKNMLIRPSPGRLTFGFFKDWAFFNRDLLSNSIGLRNDLRLPEDLLLHEAIIRADSFELLLG